MAFCVMPFASVSATKVATKDGSSFEVPAMMLQLTTKDGSSFEVRRHKTAGQFF